MTKGMSQKKNYLLLTWPYSLIEALLSKVEFLRENVRHRDSYVLNRFRVKGMFVCDENSVDKRVDVGIVQPYVNVQ